MTIFLWVKGELKFIFPKKLEINYVDLNKFVVMRKDGRTYMFMNLHEFFVVRKDGRT
jgi:hypothetical protein